MARASGDKDAGGKPRRGRARFVPLVVIAAGLAIGYALGWHHYLSLDFLAERRSALKDHVAGHYGFSLAAFFAAYVAAVAFSFPAASILTVFGGFLFGWLVGGTVVAFAATLGAVAVFLAARFALHDVMEKYAGNRAARLAEGLRKDAFGYLLVLRLAPIFPFWLVNIAPALFGVRLRSYVAATFVGILPATFAYAYLGEGVGSVLDAAERSGRDVGVKDLVTPEITIAFVLLALVAAIPVIVRKVVAARKGG